MQLLELFVRRVVNRLDKLGDVTLGATDLANILEQEYREIEMNAETDTLQAK